jgi:hypothetical protein
VPGNRKPGGYTARVIVFSWTNLHPAAGGEKGRINKYLAEKTFTANFETDVVHNEAYKTDQKTFRPGGRLGTFVCQHICEKPSGTGRLFNF